MKYKIGFDLDNTIAIYDTVFLNLDKNPETSKIRGIKGFKKKVDIANFLISNGRETEWTKLQGYIYGPLMKYASVADGFSEVISNLINNNIEFSVVSHRSLKPDSGDDINLHEYGLNWLKTNLPEIKNIFFETTKERKLRRIKTLNLNLFVDDLPYILDKIDPDIIKVLYDPNHQYASSPHLIMRDWDNFNMTVN